VTNQEVFVKSPGGVVVARSKVINHRYLAIVIWVPSGCQSVLIYLEYTSGIWRQRWPLALASTRSLWRQTFRQAAVGRWFMPILRWAISCRADGPSTVKRPDQNSGQANSLAYDVIRTPILGPYWDSDWQWSHGSEAQRSTGSLPFWESELVPGRRPNGSGYRQSADVRDDIDVTAWLAPLPFQGMVFEH